jgi:hypothetical protein
MYFNVYPRRAYQMKVLCMRRDQAIFRLLRDEVVHYILVITEKRQSLPDSVVFGHRRRRRSKTAKIKSESEGREEEKNKITCQHGSARQVVIGHVAFKGEGALFITLQSPH